MASHGAVLLFEPRNPLQTLGSSHCTVLPTDPSFQAWCSSASSWAGIVQTTQLWPRRRMVQTAFMICSTLRSTDPPKDYVCFLQHVVSKFSFSFNAPPNVLGLHEWIRIACWRIWQGKKGNQFSQVRIYRYQNLPEVAKRPNFNQHSQKCT